MDTPFNAASASSFVEDVVDAAGPTDSGQEDQAARLIAADPVTDVFRGWGFDVLPLAAERVSLLRAAAGMVPEVEVEAAGHCTVARVGALELWRFLLPVCQVVLHRARGQGRRFMLGIAGPGASGKSILAAVLRKLIGLCSTGEVRAALLPMDGFHYPNAHLDAQRTTGPDGAPLPLRALKGAPQTFDAEAFVRAVQAAATAPKLSLPRYDRRVHDPVPDGHLIRAEDRIVIVEGNYILLDRPPWHRVRPVLDLALYLDIPRRAVREAMVARHVRGGRTPEDAAAHFERVDGPNYDICAGSAGRTDIILRRDAAQAIVALEAPI